MRSLTFGFHEMRGICQAEDLLDSQEGLCSTELICLFACLCQSVSVKFNKMKPALQETMQRYHHHHHHHHLELQPFVGFHLLSQVSPHSSILSSLLLVFFNIFRFTMTSSCHRCLGLPTGLGPIGHQSNSFPVSLARSIRWICPSNLILCALMNITIPAPSINSSTCREICNIIKLYNYCSISLTTADHTKKV